MGGIEVILENISRSERFNVISFYVVTDPRYIGLVVKSLGNVIAGNYGAVARGTSPTVYVEADDDERFTLFEIHHRQKSDGIYEVIIKPIGGIGELFGSGYVFLKQEDFDEEGVDKLSLSRLHEKALKYLFGELSDRDKKKFLKRWKKDMLAYGGPVTICNVD